MGANTSRPDPEPNVFEADLGSVTVRGRAHRLSAWLVVALRATIGYVFLHTGWAKLTAPEPFDVRSHLVGVSDPSPLVGPTHWLARIEWLHAPVSAAVPWLEFLIGVALLIGLLTRLAALVGGGAMLTSYLGNWGARAGLVDSSFAYLVICLAVAAFGAGRLLGLDALVETAEIEGQAPIERYPVLRYVLG
ncbi:DoxX family protein [Halobacteriales archaeon QS_1_67_19]|nr:MAG: DoxX family protein [Halobacteriales archaeon QS_1_67_19]